MTSREDRIALAVKEIDPSVSIDPEASALLASILTSFVDDILQAGRDHALERHEKNEIRLPDLRPYAQEYLELDMLGFAIEAADEAHAVMIAAGAKRKNVSHVSKTHQDRLALKRATIDNSVLLSSVKRHKRRNNMK